MRSSAFLAAFGSAVPAMYVVAIEREARTAANVTYPGLVFSETLLDRTFYRLLLHKLGIQDYVH